MDPDSSTHLEAQNGKWEEKMRNDETDTVEKSWGAYKWAWELGRMVFLLAR